MCVVADLCAVDLRSSHQFEDETRNSPHRFDRKGKLAMANTGMPDSGGCQFFITSNAMREWNGKYTIFGVVVAGQDVVSKINEAKVRDDKPVDPVKLISVTIERVGPEPAKKRRR